MNFIDWLNSLIAEAATLIKAGGTVALAAIFLVICFKSNFSFTRILVVGLAAGLVGFLALYDGLEIVSEMLKRTVQS